MPRFNPSKLKLNLKLAGTRLQMLQKRNENLGLQARREIANLLSKNREEMARIKVEQIIRDDYLMETMEILEMYCALLTSRFGLIESVKTCDVGILEAVVTLIWASPRLHDVPELAQIREHFAARYGKEFVEQALENRNNTVHKAVIHKLSIHQPDPVLVDGYLRNIAEKYKVAWEPESTQLATSLSTSLPSVPAQQSLYPPQQPPQGAFAPAAAYPAPAAAYPATGPTGPVYAPASGYQSGTSTATPYYSVPQPYQAPAPYIPPQQPPAASGQNTLDSFPQPPTSVASPPAASVDPGFPTLPQAPGSTPASASGGGQEADPLDFDELTRRFMALKQK